jgi:signal transduction histidine kinase
MSIDRSFETLVRGPRRSLRTRLAVLMFVLLGLLGFTFVWTAYREMNGALRSSGVARIEAAARQVADLLRESASARVAETQRVADNPQIGAMVSDPAAKPPPAVDAFVARNAFAAVLLYDADGRLIRRAAAGAEIAAGRGVTAPTTVMPAGTSPLQSAAGRVWYYTTAAIAADERHPAGFVSIQRPLSSSQAGGLIERLIGSGAVIRFGNGRDDVWTDLGALTTAPPVAASGGVARYEERGEPWLGVAVPVADTPWFVWVAVAEHTMLGPSGALLRRMVPMTLLLMLTGAMAVYIVAGRITRPVENMALAAESIAAGDYSRRVVVDRDDEIGRLGGAFNVMVAKVEASHVSLERRVAARTREIEEANRELEAFSYSVSHDLRAPLRHIAGFAALLHTQSHDQLGAQGQRYLETIAEAARQMGRLVDDLLGFSRMARADMVRRDVRLDELVREVVDEVKQDAPTRHVVWRIGHLPVVTGDRAMLRLALSNLLRNAFKYTAKRSVAEIEIGCLPSSTEEHVLYVKDNGAGFDMAYADKLFGVFQRLHSPEDFEGTGIGLANVRRVVQRHGGRTWAEGKVDEGATFYVALPVDQQEVAVA